MNIIRCMVFGSDILKTFRSDAADYAAYILKRSPKRSNTAQASPLKVLAGTYPDLKDIVVFGSPCIVFGTQRTRILTDTPFMNLLLERMTKLMITKFSLPMIVSNYGY